MDTLCRTCMCEVINNVEESTIESFNIFKTEGFAQKLIQCTNLRIEPNDGYPSLVCGKCFENVLSFYDFQNISRESLEKFTKILEIKSEESDFVMDISVEDEVITDCKELELKCEKYDSLEPASEDDNFLEEPKNSIVVPELNVEVPTSSWNCNNLKRSLLKKSIECATEVEEINWENNLDMQEKDGKRKIKSKTTALTVAERSRRYREKLKLDKEPNEIHKRKQKERNAKRMKRGDMPRMVLQRLRAKEKELVRARRQSAKKAKFQNNNSASSTAPTPAFDTPESIVMVLSELSNNEKEMLPRTTET